MARVNLISSTEQPKSGARRGVSMPRLPLGWLPKSSALAIVGVGSTVLMLVVFLYVSERRALNEAQAAIVGAQADSMRLHRSFVRVRALEDSQRQLASRLDRLSGVVTGRDYWLGMLEALSESLPAYTWLEVVERVEGTVDRVQIAGATFSAAAVTAYMRGLEESDALENVELVGVMRVERDSFAVQAFTLVATFENYQPPEQSIEGEEDDE